MIDKGKQLDGRDNDPTPPDKLLREVVGDEEDRQKLLLDETEVEEQTTNKKKIQLW